MRLWLLVLLASVILGGCASFEEAYILDREYGQAQMHSWDSMIADPASTQADKQPDGLEGINAEAAMRVYDKAFTREPTRSNIIKFGIVGE